MPPLMKERNRKPKVEEFIGEKRAQNSTSQDVVQVALPLIHEIS
jgi:hypothetical protein